MALFRCSSGGGSDFKPLYWKALEIGASANPTWSNTPIKPKKVWMEFLYNKGVATTIVYTNVDNTTGEVFPNNKVKRSSDNVTWSDYGTITITNNSVTISPAPTAYASFAVFAISE